MDRILCTVSSATFIGLRPLLGYEKAKEVKYCWSMWWCWPHVLKEAEVCSLLKNRWTPQKLGNYCSVSNLLFYREDCREDSWSTVDKNPEGSTLSRSISVRLGFVWRQF